MSGVNDNAQVGGTGRRADEKEMKVWLVWEFDRMNKKIWLRVITTTERLAEDYKKMLEQQREFLSPPAMSKKSTFEIEESLANHLYGWSCLIGISDGEVASPIFSLNSLTVKPSNGSTHRQQKEADVNGAERRKGEVARQD